ncbi:MAG TPA: hypothetical protein VKU41_28365, partial [Polyangiaceae bacterium]|nr:hypothetical protein [Polyangiaceae bacterium]
DVTIPKGEVRVAFERVFDGPMGPQKGAAYAHPGCVRGYLERERERGRDAPSIEELLEKITAGSKLSADDLSEVRRAMTG